jgi:phosphoglycerol transferase MdoB-like AlkP superfamily enzyme
MLYFLVARLIFVHYHWNAVSEAPVEDWILLFWYGLKLDNSLACWIVLPSILLLSCIYFSTIKHLLPSIHAFYSIVWIVVSGVLVTIDLELFTYWGFRLDTTFLRYLSTPKEMIGTTLSAPWYILLPMAIIYISTAVYSYYSQVYSSIITDVKIKLYQVVTLVIIAASLIIPIRGGLQQIPINESVCFYSSYPMSNQAAINPVWTFFRSMIEKPEENPNKYVFSDVPPAALYPRYSHAIDTLFTTPRPNIILLVWESLTQKVLKPDVTPHLCRLSQEGYFFPNVYASGDRSDKGLVALLSAFPAQPDFSIMTDPAKSARLHYLPKVLAPLGYTSYFHYGGEMAFANMGSFMSFAGFNSIVSIQDYPSAVQLSKWGVPDEYTLSKTWEMANTAQASGKPFFITHFTLSSHEPFDVPYKGPVQSGTPVEQKFKNAHHYTDLQVHRFIEKARSSSWWDSTVIIIIADHGNVLPNGDFARHIPSEFHIPMIWTGGALSNPPYVSSALLSQTDLAALLCQQLHISSPFLYSKGLYADTTEVPVMTYFNDGFGVVRSDSNFLLFDLNRKQVGFEYGRLPVTDLNYGKRYTQVLMEDFLRK